MDYFALLHEPRRPWLDVERLKQKFFTLSAETHPDRAHAGGETETAAATRNFAELNAAWQCLRDPKDRLGHLLELEMGARTADARDVPAPAMDLFFEVGRICREADAFLAAREKISSALLKARKFGEGMELSDRLGDLQGRLGNRREELLAELKEMNQAWDAAPAPGSDLRPTALPLARLEAMYRMLSYLARWTGQIQERLVWLSF